MSKFHLASDGPKPCHARERHCPLGGEHFSRLADAEVAFARKLGGGMDGHRKALETKEAVVVYTNVKPMAGGHYFGCEVPKESLTHALDLWREEIGRERAEAMEKLKAQRDRGYIYHMTAITPPEMKAIKGSASSAPENVAIEYCGVGMAEDKGNEAWYMVCAAPEVQTWRAANGLGEKDLHITLGFMPKDVHTKPKGMTTIVPPLASS